MDGTAGRRKGRAAFWEAALALVVVGLVAVPGLRAQQTGDSSSRQDTSDEQASGSVPPAPVTTNLITGQALEFLVTPWRWGRLSLLSVGLNYGYDTNVLLQQNNGISNTVYSAQGLLVYSIQKQRSSLVLQYAPSIFTSSRVTEANYLGHTISFNTYRDLTPQWRLDISDSFQFVPSQNRLFTPSFAQDFSSGTITQQPVLATGEKYLTDSLSATVTHPLSATDNISFTSSYNVNNVYANSTSTIQSPSLGQTFGAGVSWMHQWTESRQIGLTYQYSRTILGGASTGSLYYTVMATYAQQLSPSIRMELSYGPSYGITQSNSNGLVTINTQKTYQGSFSLQKTFRRSALSFHFSRSQNFSGIVSNSLNNRYDVAYIRPLGTRWSVSTGASYLEQTALTQGVVRGRTSWVQCGYQLSRNWTAVVSYSYFDMRGTTQPFVGLMVSAGLRWSWNPESRTNPLTGNP